MKILLISLGLLLFSSAQAYNPKYEKKLKKELSSVFENYDHSKCELIRAIVDSTSNITSEIYSINGNAENKLGYFAVSQGNGRFETFDFLVIYDLNKQIQKVKILLYCSTYGYEIGSKRWLQQFKEHDVHHHFKYNDDIQGISGATVSGRGLTEGINRLNVLMEGL